MKKNMIIRSFWIGTLVVLFGVAPSLAQDYLQDWIDQFGSSPTFSADYAQDVATDLLGNAYAVGSVQGILGGSSAGDTDAYIRKYTSSGNVLWTTQIGTAGSDTGYDVAVDSAGNSYITGNTLGTFPGETGYTGQDAFVSKFDSTGNPLWTRQLAGSGVDDGNGVAVDGAGNVYVAGRTGSSLGAPVQVFDAYLAKYNSAGSLQWVQQLGTSVNDGAQDVVIDAAGDIYITGFTGGSLLGGTHYGYSDAFVAKYDDTGAVQWISQIGGVYDEFSYDMTLDDTGGIYITGQTNYEFATTTTSGNRDVFVSKFATSDGAVQWISQFGGTSSEMGYGIAADDSGNLFISGTTWGVLEGSTAGDYDAFIGEIDPADGTPLWLDQFGTSGKDEANGITALGNGTAYIAGYTYGTLGQTNYGGYDAFVEKIIDVPEPSTILMLLAGLATLALWRRR